MILSQDKQLDIQYIKYLLGNPTVCVPSMLLFGEPGGLACPRPHQQWFFRQ